MAERVALVTGASRGIGAACAARLAADGFAVAVNYSRSASEAHEVVARIEADGGRAAAFPADIADPSAASSLLERVAQWLQPPLVVVNNAGVQRSRAMISQPVDDFDATVALNLRGSWVLTQAALPAMYDAGWGRVVFVSSVLAASGGPGDTAYSATKAATVAVAKSLAQEVSWRGITANAVLPGTISTDLLSTVDAEVLERNIAGLVARRPGSADEVANVVAFLSSDDASYVNGAEVVVHGGGWLTAPPG